MGQSGSASFFLDTIFIEFLYSIPLPGAFYAK